MEMLLGMLVEMLNMGEIQLKMLVNMLMMMLWKMPLKMQMEMLVVMVENI